MFIWFIWSSIFFEKKSLLKLVMLILDLLRELVYQSSKVCFKIALLFCDSSMKCFATFELFSSKQLKIIFNRKLSFLAIISSKIVCADAHGTQYGLQTVIKTFFALGLPISIPNSSHPSGAISCCFSKASNTWGFFWIRLNEK